MNKILVVTNSSTFSGAEKVESIIAENLKNKYEFLFVLVGEGNFQKILEEKGIKYVTVKKISKQVLKKIISEYNPTIVYANDFRASFYSARAVKKIPIISHIHQTPLWLRKVCLKSLIFAFSSLKAKKVLIVSNSIYEEYVFKRILKDKVEVVLNPVSCLDVTSQVEIQEKSDDFDLCYVGRLAEVKRVDRIIDIVYNLKKDKKEIKCAIVGDGDLMGTLKRRVQQLNLEDNISFFGFLSNPYNIINNSKIFLLTSQWEGYGLVAFEAMALGVPVVASNVGGLKEIIDSECGYLCNDIVEYEEEVTKLLNDPKYYAEKSANAVRKAKKLDNLQEYLKRMDETFGKIGENNDN